jgi:hypothetical protein
METRQLSLYTVRGYGIAKRGIILRKASRLAVGHTTRLSRRAQRVFSSPGSSGRVVTLIINFHLVARLKFCGAPFHPYTFKVRLSTQTALQLRAMLKNPLLSDFQSDNDENSSLLECENESLSNWFPTFRRFVSPLSSRMIR